MERIEVLRLKYKQLMKNIRASSKSLQDDYIIKLLT